MCHSIIATNFGAGLLFSPLWWALFLPLHMDFDYFSFFLFFFPVDLE